jgi:hypothetical protein
MPTLSLLFCRGELRVFLESCQTEVVKEIQKQDSNYLLNVNPSDFTAFIFQNYYLEPITLEENNITVDQEEKDVDVSRDSNRWIEDRNRPFYLKGTKITYFIPFKGNSSLFDYRPSTYNLNPPQGTVDDQNQTLILSFEGVGLTADQVKQAYGREIAEIKKWLGWISGQVQQYNQQLKSTIEDQVKKRREKLLQDRGLVADLGFPMKKRMTYSTTYAVPEIRRKLVPKPTASTDAFKPEPTLPLEDYEYILRVVSNMAQVMERSPKAFLNMKEEDIRQHFLVQLNGAYEGQATGETFNYEGKTDILIRFEGKNIFIAECKFWGGPEAFMETIDQILKYLSWRDSKTAIILFNRTKNLSNVLAQIPDLVSSHPNFKSQIPIKSETGFRFKMSNKDDKNKDFLLTVMLFDVPTSETKSVN